MYRTVNSTTFKAQKIDHDIACKSAKVRRTTATRKIHGGPEYRNAIFFNRPVARCGPRVIKG